ncbi:DUF4145 domain-containing protein [Proteus mirabilis]|uniref:DUF4145 domain-containing protein n=1 Tax=Proteus mirabilis TaxID=584 RepID=UPI003F199104
MAYLHYFSHLHCTLCGHTVNYRLLYSTPQAKQQSHYNGITTWRESDTHFSGLFTCDNCRNPVMIQFHIDEELKINPNLKGLFNRPYLFLNRIKHTEISGSPPQQAYTLDVSKWGEDLRQAFIIDSVMPEQSDTIPVALPNDIRSMYVDDLLQVTGSPRHVLIACRAILEATCKDKLTQPKGNLVNLIERLVQEGYLPKAISEWAHTIREFGNSAVHESVAPERETANEIMMFTKTLLELMYSYPEKIQEIRKDHPKNGVAK